MIKQLRVGQFISPIRMINPTMISHWRYSRECCSIGGGIMPGAELRVAEISDVPGAMWVKAELQNRTPVACLKISGEEFGGNFRVASVPAGNEAAVFESSVQGLEAELANVGVHLHLDSSIRQIYVARIRELSDELRQSAMKGHISWSKAAAHAHAVRNETIAIVRDRSTPVGKAFAEKLKRDGKTLNELVARKTLQMHGPNVDFARLSASQKNVIYGEIVKSAGRSNVRVTASSIKLSYAGRSLIVLSMAVSAYNIMSAENKVQATAREAVVTGSGIAGGFAGGMLAGLACGPGAPVCVTIGAFVAGTLAAFGVDFTW